MRRFEFPVQNVVWNPYLSYPKKENLWTRRQQNRPPPFLSSFSLGARGKSCVKNGCELAARSLRAATFELIVKSYINNLSIHNIIVAPLPLSLDCHRFEGRITILSINPPSSSCASPLKLLPLHSSRRRRHGPPASSSWHRRRRTRRGLLLLWRRRPMRMTVATSS